VLEATERAGGVVGTESCEGALLERGPDTLVTHKPAGIALCRELGLGDRLLYPAPERTDILLSGELLPVPAGFALLAPTRRWPILVSPLLDWRGKLSALREPSVPPAPPPEDGDESVASFVRRRFGDELLERIVEPMIGAIYLADVERLSLRATLPRFLALEREHGSVTRGLGAARADQAAKPAVATLSGGLGQIVDALVAGLPAGALRLDRGVSRLSRGPEGFVLELANGDSLSAAAVLLAIPAHRATPLLREFAPALAGSMSEISYASCVTVYLAWPLERIARPPRSSGFFVPRGAGLELVAASFVSVKFPERVSGGQLVARLFFGGAARPEVSGRTDDELAGIAARELAPLLGVRELPSWVRIHRHPLAMPQLAVGHLDRVSRIRAWALEHPGLELTGGPVGAYGLPDSIAAGESAAERLFSWLTSPGRRSS
jgi:oxygen-dependent protoporphyrinogen oxidase